MAAASSTSRSTTGSRTSSSATLAGGRRPEARPRPPAEDAADRAVAAAAAGQRINPWDGVWRSVGWLADGAWIAAVGERETAPQDLWLLPVPGVAPDDARPRQVTDSLPAVLRAALGPGRAARPASGSRSRRATACASRARSGARPTATGKRGGSARPDDRLPARRPDRRRRSARFQPFKQLLVAEGFAFLDVDFRGSTGYGRAFRLANHDEWGHADVHDLIDAARWAAEQPWSDGRLAIYGGSYGGYMVLCALVEEPALWRAGVDLYGDSEIAESYRHGDRLGRLDLHKMMGSPDDAERAAVYRRGSPVYRAERIEAPLLILHGRKDKRVVPLMTERMVEALEIEGKHLRGPLVRRRGPRLGEAREPARRVRADPRVPQGPRPRRAARTSRRSAPAPALAEPSPASPARSCVADADPDEHVAELNTLANGHPRGQREQVGQRLEDRVRDDDAVRVARSATPADRRRSRRVGRHRAAVRDDRREVARRRRPR